MHLAVGIDDDRVDAGAALVLAVVAGGGAIGRAAAVLGERVVAIGVGHFDGHELRGRQALLERLSATVDARADDGVVTEAESLLAREVADGKQLVDAVAQRDRLERDGHTGGADALEAALEAVVLLAGVGDLIVGLGRRAVLRDFEGARRPTLPQLEVALGDQGGVGVDGQHQSELVRVLVDARRNRDGAAARRR